MNLRVGESRFRPTAFSEFKDGRGSLSVYVSSKNKYHVEIRNLNRPGQPPVTGYIMWKEKSLNAVAKGAQKIPANISSALTNTDPSFAPGKKHCKMYGFQLKASQRYTFELFSTYDNYLYLQVAAGRILTSNDDGGPRLNAKIVYTPRTSGVYRVVATSLTGRYTGPFNLKASAGIR